MATDFAVRMARLTDGEVVLHHAYSTLVDWVTVPVEEESKFPEVKNGIGKVRHQLHEVAGKYTDVQISTQLSFYETVEELLHDAGQEHVDLIVAGTHGRRDVSNLILGSDAQRIIRLAPCPVVILNRPPQRFPFENVLFVCDFRENVCTQFGRLLELVAPLDARVHLGYINTPLDFQTTDIIEERMAKVDQAFPERRFVKHIYNHLRTDTGIKHLAERIGADAISMVTHGRTGWNRLFAQSMTETLALDSPVPVISFHV